LRESAVREFGTEPTFVSNPQKSKRTKWVAQEHAIAMRAEFVLKPGEEDKVHKAIDEIVSNSFAHDEEFLQGLVLVSEMESRLVTVITFWHPNGFAESRERRVHWLGERLAPFLDKSLRVQTFSAHVMEAKVAEISKALTIVEENFSTASRDFLS
jgi:hypothetical protein